MIVSHMFGGLGNQLFQFAIGKAMAARLGVEFRMDSRYFDRPRPDNLMAWMPPPGGIAMCQSDIC